MKKTLFIVAALMCAVTTFATGKFSVAAGKQVTFAQGNVQFHVKDSVWRIAPTQLDWCGNANLEVGNPNYDGWIDLLEWSLGPKNNYGATSNYDTLLYCNEKFVDWGRLFPGQELSTLSSDEWYYLLNQREGWDSKWGIAYVGDTLGMILLPDEWTAPAGVTFVPKTIPTSEVWADDDMIDPSEDHYRVKKANMPANKFTLAEWKLLEDAGALFLPYAGRRSGGYGNYLNTKCIEQATMFRYSYYENYLGTYWTKTVHNAAKGQCKYLYTFEYYGGEDYRWGVKMARWGENGRYGQSVRLAHKLYKEKGDTIRYEYQGNNLFYKITAKDGEKRTVSVVNAGGANPNYYPDEADKPKGAVILPDSVEDVFGVKYAVTQIGSFAFTGCEGVTSIVLNDYITELSSYLFNGTSITSFDLKNVKKVNYAAFSGITLTTVHIGDQLETFAPDSYMLYNVTSVTIDENNPNFSVMDNMLFNKDTTTLVAMPIKLKDAVYNLPMSLTLIGNDAVSGQLGAIVFPKVIAFEKYNPSPASYNLSNAPLGDIIVPCGLKETFEAGELGKTLSLAKSITERLMFEMKLESENGTILKEEVSCNQFILTAEPATGYEFDRWTDDAAAVSIRMVDVTSDTTYTALFKLTKYIITFLNDDKTILSSKEWEYGTIPTCEEPTKPEDEQYTYEFAGWTPEVVPVTTGATYTATYTAHEKHPADVEHVSSADLRLIKFIRNGQLYLLRDGKLYNAQGARVE